MFNIEGTNSAGVTMSSRVSARGGIGKKEDAGKEGADRLKKNGTVGACFVSAGGWHGAKSYSGHRGPTMQTGAAAREFSVAGLFLQSTRQETALRLHGAVCRAKKGGGPAIRLAGQGKTVRPRRASQLFGRFSEGNSASWFRWETRQARDASRNRTDFSSKRRLRFPFPQAVIDAPW